MNRLLVFFLLAGLLYALYRYQYVLFGTKILPLHNDQKQINNIKHTDKDVKKITYREQNNKNVPNRKNNIKGREKEVSIDNISQLSLGSLDNEDGNQAYKLDSILGSIDSGSRSGNGTEESGGTMGSENSSFFF